MREAERRALHFGHDIPSAASEARVRAACRNVTELPGGMYCRVGRTTAVQLFTEKGAAARARGRPRRAARQGGV